jgi:hypothetical protein
VKESKEVKPPQKDLSENDSKLLSVKIVKRSSPRVANQLSPLLADKYPDFDIVFTYKEKDGEQKSEL